MLDLTHVYELYSHTVPLMAIDHLCPDMEQ